jgi:hypothetical protein
MKRVESMVDNQNLGIPELVRLFLFEKNEERECRLIDEIRGKGLNSDLLMEIDALAKQKASFHRSRSVDLLAIFAPLPEFSGLVVRKLIEMLAEETDDEVLQSICLAFNRITLPDSDPELCVLAENLALMETHPSAVIREALAIAFGMHMTPCTMNVLRHLTEDKDKNVRQWAAYGLKKGSP